VLSPACLLRQRVAHVVGRLTLAGLAAFVAASTVSAQEVTGAQLGPAPRVTDLRVVASGGAAGPGETLSPVDRTDRAAVVDFFNTVYLPALALPTGWTGSVAGCNAGTTSAAYAAATMDMVNYFRAMTGLPASVTHEAVKDGKSQQAALMMTANNQLNHAPPDTWSCYTAAGAEAAGKSNLALGAAGPYAITLYMSDPGAGNTALGHRRWILYPREVEMGTGSTNNANDLWVIGPFGSRPASPTAVAWPPDGFVPYHVVYPRWSFSLNTSLTVNFSNATVSMTAAGKTVSPQPFAQATGYGDNTLGWESGLSFSAGTANTVVQVRIDNVLVDGVATNYSYTVTVIDPALPGPPVFTDDPLVARSTPVKAAHVVELRQAVDALRARRGIGAFAWTDGALAVRSTPVKAQHIIDLRAALDGVYAAAGRTPPTYSRTLTPRQAVVAAVDVADLRAAVLAIW
jgi:hypothetical protein